jgi:hypothetical protein
MLTSRGSFNNQATLSDGDCPPAYSSMCCRARPVRPDHRMAALIIEHCLPCQVLLATIPILETVGQKRLQRLAGAIDIAVTPVDFRIEHVISW